jgi:hypothetical protein
MIENRLRVTKYLLAIILVGLTTVGWSLRSHAADYKDGALHFYGAQLPSETVQVTVFTEGRDEITVRGNFTLTHAQWVVFAAAVVTAGFQASQGEPKPVGKGGAG